MNATAFSDMSTDGRPSALTPAETADTDKIHHADPPRRAPFTPNGGRPRFLPIRSSGGVKDYSRAEVVVTLARRQRLPLMERRSAGQPLVARHVTIAQHVAADIVKVNLLLAHGDHGCSSLGQQSRCAEHRRMVSGADALTRQSRPLRASRWRVSLQLLDIDTATAQHSTRAAL